MSHFSPLIAVFTVLLFSPVCYTAYSSTSRANVALYWGQGAGQQRLLHFCQQSTVDIIPIGFVDIFPAQGNGFPGTNFGNQCWGPNNVYPGPGPNPSLNQLQSDCPQIAADVPVCQNTYGKKIILSLGGGSNTYQLTGAAEGAAFADFLWGAFGPQTASWLAKGLPRPFDGPGNAAVEVDGFDFDIEYPSTDNAAGYIAMIQRLRSLFSSANKPYLITGAPQCIVADANMGHMISAVQFDILFIQYYNTPQCSARSWVASNPNYLSSGVEQLSGFTYNDWSTSLAGTPSANAKIYIGLLGDVSGNYYLNSDETKSLVKAYFCKPNFGGVMIWEATSSDNNAAGPYYVTVKNILTNFISDTSLSCYVGPPKSWTVLTLSTSTKTTLSYDIHLSGIKLVSIPDPIPTSGTTSKPTASAKLTTTSKPISSQIPSSTSKLTSSIKLTTTSKPISILSSTSKPTSSLKLTTTSKVIPILSSTTKPTTSQKLTTTSKLITTLSSNSKPTTSSKLTTTSNLTPVPIPSSSSKPTTSQKLTTTIKAISSSSSSSKKVTTTTTIITTTKLTLTSKTPPAATPTIVIPAGACGAPYGNSCGPGFCCSQYGYCGSGTAWCGAGCQSAFGMCY